MTKLNTRLSIARAPLTAMNSAVTLQPGLSDLVVAYIDGVIACTVAFEGSFDSTDGVNGVWRSLAAHSVNATNSYTQQPTVTFTGVQSQGTFYTFRTLGLPWVRLRVSAYTSGTAVGVLEARNSAF